MKHHTPSTEELLEAIRLTQEYAQLPALPGWTWYDTYRRWRPEDAERLRREWERHEDAQTRMKKAAERVREAIDNQPVDTGHWAEDVSQERLEFLQDRAQAAWQVWMEYSTTGDPQKARGMHEAMARLFAELPEDE